MSEIIARVSHLEAYRRWRLNEEATLDDLVAYLEQEPAEVMRVGTELHQALEDFDPAQHGVELDEIISGNGYRFVFNCDITLPAFQIKELRGEKHYGNLIVSGKADGINGLIGEDYKTTTLFNAERYLDGYQWRFYMDIFDLAIFRWHVFVLTPDRKEPNVYIVNAYHSLEAARYANLHADCWALTNDFYDFVKANRIRLPEPD